MNRAKILRASKALQRLGGAQNRFNVAVDELSEEEYNKARQEALDLLINPQVPKNWQEAASLCVEKSESDK